MYEYLDPITQNVSIPWRNNQAGSPSIVAAFYGDIIAMQKRFIPKLIAPTGNNPYNYFAVNLNASIGRNRQSTMVEHCSTSKLIQYMATLQPSHSQA